jgi:UDP-glucose 4-epimerase
MIGITGATGVLGKLIVSKLRSDETPHTCFQGDIRDSYCILNWLNENNVSQIIHLAAIVSTSKVENNKFDALDVNVGGVLSLIKAISKYSNPIFLFFASSSHVYKSSDKVLTEDDLLEPINFYGHTKKIGEDILKCTFEQNDQVKITIGRIFSFYHKSQSSDFLYPAIIKRVSEEDLNKPFLVRGSKSVRDFLNAEDVASIIIKICKKEYTGVLNIASGEPISIFDFVRNIVPEGTEIQEYEDEKVTKLVADISKLKTILLNNETPSYYHNTNF